MAAPVGAEIESRRGQRGPDDDPDDPHHTSHHTGGLTMARPRPHEPGRQNAAPCDGLATPITPAACGNLGKNG